jgi:hypothetical protein
MLAYFPMRRAHRGRNSPALRGSAESTAVPVKVHGTTYRPRGKGQGECPVRCGGRTCVDEVSSSRGGPLWSQFSHLVRFVLACIRVRRISTVRGRRMWLTGVVVVRAGRRTGWLRADGLVRWLTVSGSRTCPQIRSGSMCSGCGAAGSESIGSSSCLALAAGPSANCFTGQGVTGHRCAAFARRRRSACLPSCRCRMNASVTVVVVSRRPFHPNHLSVQRLLKIADDVVAQADGWGRVPVPDPAGRRA